MNGIRVVGYQVLLSTFPRTKKVLRDFIERQRFTAEDIIMNVLQLLLTGTIGGIEVLCKDYSQYSTQNNIFYFGFGSGLVVDEMIRLGAKVIRRNFSKRNFLLMVDDLEKVCIENSIEVIVVQVSAPFCCYAAQRVAKKCNIRLYLYAHAVRSHMLCKSRPLMHLACMATFYPAARNADKIFAISNEVKNSFASDKRIIDKFEVVYNGTDVSKYIPEETAKKGNKEVVFLYVGRLIKIKGIDHLLESVAQAPELNAHIYIVGDGAEKMSLEKLAEQLGICEKVTFCGADMQLAKWQKKAHFFIHPSTFDEGFGITLIEAMAAGLPCIAYPKGAIPEIVSDGDNGYLMPNLSVDALTATMKKAIKTLKEQPEKYETMRTEARKTAEKFSIQNMAKELDAKLEG